MNQTAFSRASTHKWDESLQPTSIALGPSSLALRKRLNDAHTSSVQAMRSAPVVGSGPLPVDFLADPDGDWEYEALLASANFDPTWGTIGVGALTQPFSDFPEGAAVVTLTTGSHQSTVLVDCTQTIAAA